MSWHKITTDWGERYIGCRVQFKSGDLNVTGVVTDAGEERVRFDAAGDRDLYLDLLIGDELWLDTEGRKPAKVWDSEVKEYATVLYGARQAKLDIVVPTWDDLVATHKEAWYYAAAEGLKWADFPGRNKRRCSNCGQTVPS
jgi:hypothetical protein